MWENYGAGKLQNFYRKFIKCEREAGSLSKVRIFKDGKKRTISIKNPIDPLYRFPYPEKYRIRIVEKPFGTKKYNVWHFNINSLIQWLNVSKEWINPLTNCLFLNATQDKIKKFTEQNKTRRKLKIKVKYNKNEKGYVKKKLKPLTYVSTTMGKWMELINYVKNSDNKDCFNFLNKYYYLIENDKMDLDADINYEITINNEIINSVGLLHIAINNGDIDMLNQLIYFGCNMSKKCGEKGYTPLHLCAILNNIEMAKILIQYGVSLEETCIFENSICTIFEICEKIKHYKFIDNLLSLIN